MLSEGATPETVPWSAFTYAHMQALRTRLAAECPAPATANRHLAAVRGVVQECANLGFMSHEQAAGVAAVKGVRGHRLPKGRALSADEVRALLDACDTATTETMAARDRALLYVLFGGGLRRAEASGLGGLQMHHVKHGAKVTSLKVHGKGNKERMVPLPKDAAEALRAWMKVRGSEPGPLFVSFTRWGGMRRVGGADGELRGLSDCGGIEHVLAAITQRAGVAPFSPHDARRTRLTNLFAAGQPARAIQKLAGHESIVTTTRYDRSDDETMERAALSVDVT